MSAYLEGVVTWCFMLKKPPPIANLRTYLTIESVGLNEGPFLYILWLRGEGHCELRFIKNHFIELSDLDRLHYIFIELVVASEAFHITIWNIGGQWGDAFIRFIRHQHLKWVSGHHKHRVWEQLIRWWAIHIMSWEAIQQPISAFLHLLIEVAINTCCNKAPTQNHK